MMSTKPGGQLDLSPCTLLATSNPSTAIELIFHHVTRRAPLLQQQRRLFRVEAPADPNVNDIGKIAYHEERERQLQGLHDLLPGLQDL